MPEEATNPNRLLIFTDQPSDAATYEAKGWHMSDMLVMKFYPTLNPDWKNPKRYALKFWRQEQPSQRELL